MTVTGITVSGPLMAGFRQFPGTKQNNTLSIIYNVSVDFSKFNILFFVTDAAEFHQIILWKHVPHQQDLLGINYFNNSLIFLSYILE